MSVRQPASQPAPSIRHASLRPHSAGQGEGIGSPADTAHVERKMRIQFSCHEHSKASICSLARSTQHDLYSRNDGQSQARPGRRS